MPTARLTQTIDKPVGDVFKVVSDLTTFPKWNPTTASATSLTEGDPGLGSKFELAVKGFGKQEMELTEFEKDQVVRLTPHSSMFEGGHRFSFTADGDKTRIDHELVMKPKGIWVLMSPVMGMMSRKNLKKTAKALETYMEA